ncbi:MAG: tetratricopeptide repeat protein [Streptosporangiaceae bacterium]|nr:tetratricopeptide repeat protein [Streptosporangiaceae bacterium]
MGAQLAAAPVLSGAVPPLADSYHPRPETGLGLADGLRPGETIVLTHGSDAGARATAAGPDGAQAGGTGKTQLAVAFAHAVWNARVVDLLVWVPATNRETIVTSFAQAAGEVDAHLPGENADAAAGRFLSWLSRTRRRWAVILDDLADEADLDELWPHGETGQVIVTTRLPDTALRGPDRKVVQVEGFSRREALGYLNARLTGYPDQRIEALDLAEDLGRLPLSLAQAAALIVDRGQGCREYRVQYAERLQHTSGAATDACPGPILATWSLAVERAHELQPAGLAWPALALAAMLDVSGIPAAALTSPSACGYITGRPSTAGSGDQDLVRAAFSNLARLGLVTVDPVSPARTVRMHAAAQTAVRAYLPRTDVEQVVNAAAAALLDAWPERDAGPQLDQALRDCAASLRDFAGDVLWKPEAHPVLLRAGRSLEDALLADSAITYWQGIAAASTRLLGPGHAQAVQARDRLAAAYETAGRLADAMTVFETALADRERNLGADHPDTLTARVNLAHSYLAAAREDDAIRLYESTLSDSERLLGTAHRDTLAVRASLASAYQATGREDESIRLYERTLAESERAVGPVHRDTLTARASLAAAYQAVGKMRQAIAAYERTVADRERAQGADHPDTLTARGSLANAYRVAKRPKDAIPQYERILADRERIQGADHPDTLTARGNLAYVYREAGRLKDAIPVYERTLIDRERAQGPDHRDTLTARSNLAAAYQLARRLHDAIPQYERAVADSERMLGAGDMETLTTRCNLATAYYTAGRLMDVVTVLQRALADCEQYLGPDDPMTDTVRANLQAATQE